MNYNQLTQLTIVHPTGALKGCIPLARSKSISNRALIIQALCQDALIINNLSDSDDTALMQKLLQQSAPNYDAHHAGTTYRFLTSYLATKSGEQILTGSSRMKERPIKALVEALKSLGADIAYLENIGFPPLKIGNPPKEWQTEVTLAASISSQYISSLLLIAPTLPKGLRIILTGDLVSRPYLDMTVQIMRYFGAKVDWEGQNIVVSPGPYLAQPLTIESDWSAASYYYSMAALANKAEIFIEGLQEDSLQGDSQMADMASVFGVNSYYEDDGVMIVKEKAAKSFFERNFLETPDLAQTLFVMCAGNGCNGLYTGLKTLKIKETDRISAMKTELEKVGIFLSEVPKRFAKNTTDTYYMQEGKAKFNPEARIQTYRDHRMAMAFAPLALKFPITIDHPGVVTKSYPTFWEHLVDLGFKIEGK